MKTEEEIREEEFWKDTKVEPIPQKELSYQTKLKIRYGNEFWRDTIASHIICESCDHLTALWEPECTNCQKPLNGEIEHSYRKWLEKKTKVRIPDKEGVNVDMFVSNVYLFHKYRPFFYDKQQLFWMWDPVNYQYEIVDEIDLFNTLEYVLRIEGKTFQSKVKSNYLEALKRIGRQKIPKEAPPKWIQFRKIAFSINSKKIYEVTPDYFFTNPIPHELAESDETPIMDYLFEQWVGNEHVQTLYEIIAYCTYRAYPIHKIFCMFGSGSNGKSCFLRLLTKYLGQSNAVSTELDLITGGQSRFETSKMYKKLICQMGETSHGAMKNSEMLKKLSGGDMIGYEVKNKQPFDDYNYTKIIISSNSLPQSDDDTDGFFRRWMIINFPNQFSEGKDPLQQIPVYEYDSLSRKIINILPGLLERGKFQNSDTIEQRRDAYILASNPLPVFVRENCVVGDDEYCLYGELYTKYLSYLKNNKKRRVKPRQFKASLEDQGFFVQKTSKNIDGQFKAAYWIEGVRLLGQNEKNPIMTKMTVFPYDSPTTTTTLLDNKGHNSHNGTTDAIKQGFGGLNYDSKFSSSHFSHKSHEKMEKKVALSRIQVIDMVYDAKKDKDGMCMIEDIQSQISWNIDDDLGYLLGRGDFFQPKPGYIKRL